MADYFDKWLIKIDLVQFFSRSTPANVCAVFDYILKILNMMPEPG